LCPDKTSYPTNRYYLYYSGSERSFGHVATPAPRGHRAVGRGTSGRVLFACLAAAVRSAGVTIVPQTRASHLVEAAAGEVIGIECMSMRDAAVSARLAHRVAHKLGKKLFLYAGGFGRRMHRPVAWLERRHAKSLTIGARRGVVIAAGGFVANRELLREHAPAFRGGLPLGTVADDGSGIQLGVGAGGATRFLGRVSCWRFITPPPAFAAGLLVDRSGSRICDESRYGAAIGEAMVREHGEEARAELIRVQCELAVIEARGRTEAPAPGTTRRLMALRRRERGLRLYQPASASTWAYPASVDSGS